MNEERDLPRYEYLDDLVLIGVDHLQEIEEGSVKTNKFLDHVSNADHLIFEGNKKLYDYPDSPHYEVLAYFIFGGRKPTYFLEEDVDFFELCKKYSVRDDMIGLYTLLLGYGNAITSAQGNYDFLLDILQKDLKNCTLYYPGFEKIDRASVLEKTPRMITTFSKRPSDILDVGVLFNSYLANLRNYEVMGPKIREYKQTLPEKKAAIMGDLHVDYLVPYLRGEIMQSPLRWNEYVKTLDEATQSVVDKIENELFKE